jgi:predicted RNA-binding Zn-ribbon protein involved in translation (DUF1610 family)
MSDDPERQKRREKLFAEKTLPWWECAATTHESEGYQETVVLECPLCLQGSIVRTKDNEPGFRDSSMTKCKVCGLTGDGSKVELETARDEFKE